MAVDHHSSDDEPVPHLAGAAEPHLAEPHLQERVTQAMMLAQSGDPIGCLELVDQLLPELNAPVRSELRARALYARAVAWHWAGNNDRALAAADELLEMTRASGMALWESNALSMRASQRILSGEVDAGMRDLVTAEIFLEGAAGDPLTASYAHTGVAVAYDQLRLYELALPHFLEALRLEPTDGWMPEGRAIDLLNLAEFHLRWALELDSVDQHADALLKSSMAERYAARCAVEAERLPRDRWVRGAAVLLGCAQAHGGQADAAIERLQANLPALDELGLLADAAFARLFLALAHERSGDLPSAAAAVEQAAARLPEHAGWSLEASVRHARARIVVAGCAASGAGHAMEYADMMARAVWEQRLRTLKTAQALLSVERIRSERDAITEASHQDPLTGVGNRRRLDRELRELRDAPTLPGRWVAALMIDVDRFKQTNDVLGHLAGDTVLREVAGMLTAHARAKDVVVRTGGDEFVVLLVDTDLDEATAIAERLLTTSERLGVGLAAPQAPVTLSIGVAAALDLLDTDALLAQADRAMYEAKRAGGGRVRVTT
ncbi:MAG: diguanylate cyclase [Actinomycetes bacterium]